MKNDLEIKDLKHLKDGQLRDMVIRVLNSHQLILKKYQEYKVDEQDPEYFEKKYNQLKGVFLMHGGFIMALREEYKLPQIEYISKTENE